MFIRRLQVLKLLRMMCLTRNPFQPSRASHYPRSLFLKKALLTHPKCTDELVHYCGGAYFTFQAGEVALYALDKMTLVFPSILPCTSANVSTFRNTSHSSTSTGEHITLLWYYTTCAILRGALASRQVVSCSSRCNFNIRKPRNSTRLLTFAPAIRTLRT